MKILVFGGTTEGRELSERLVGLGHEVTVSVATDLGAEELRNIKGLKVLTGRLEIEAMADLMGNYELCIDATHPYAKAATDNIKKAAKEADITLKRLLRNESFFEGATVVESAKGAAEYLNSRKGNVLLATGIKDLHFFEALDRERVFVRTLPVISSIEICEQQEIPHKNIIAMQGPFSLELNEALIHQLDISFLVTKDGGKSGGFDEKREAAKHCGIELVVISRPEDSGEDMESIIACLENPA